MAGNSFLLNDREQAVSGAAAPCSWTSCGTISGSRAPKTAAAKATAARAWSCSVRLGRTACLSDGQLLPAPRRRSGRTPRRDHRRSQPSGPQPGPTSPASTRARSNADSARPGSSIALTGFLLGGAPAIGGRWDRRAGRQHLPLYGIRFHPPGDRPPVRAIPGSRDGGGAIPRTGSPRSSSAAILPRYFLDSPGRLRRLFEPRRAPEAKPPRAELVLPSSSRAARISSSRRPTSSATRSCVFLSRREDLRGIRVEGDRLLHRGGDSPGRDRGVSRHPAHVPRSAAGTSPGSPRSPSGTGRRSRATSSTPRRPAICRVIFLALDATAGPRHGERAEDGAAAGLFPGLQGPGHGRGRDDHRDPHSRPRRRRTLRFRESRPPRASGHRRRQLGASSSTSRASASSRRTSRRGASRRCRSICAKTSAFLHGQAGLGGDRARSGGHRGAGEISPISDVRGSADYKRALLRA